MSVDIRLPTSTHTPARAIRPQPPGGKLDSCCLITSGSLVALSSLQGTCNPATPGKTHNHVFTLAMATVVRELGGPDVVVLISQTSTRTRSNTEIDELLLRDPSLASTWHAVPLV